MQARVKLGMDIEHDWNIGFVGNSGQGKSSLINALRGAKAGSPGKDKLISLFFLLPGLKPNIIESSRLVDVISISVLPTTHHNWMKGCYCVLQAMLQLALWNAQRQLSSITTLVPHT